LYILDFAHDLFIRPRTKFAITVEVFGMSRRLSARPRESPLAIGFGTVVILVTAQVKSSQGFV
jgi:hypothetical protein